MYPEELERLISAVIADGQFTDKERGVIRRKAQELGLDPDEVEIIVEARCNERKGSFPQQRSFFEENKTALIVAGIAGTVVLVIIISIASMVLSGNKTEVREVETVSPTYTVESEDVTGDDFNEAMEEAAAQVEQAAQEAQQQIDEAMREMESSSSSSSSSSYSSSSSSSSSSSYSDDDDDDDSDYSDDSSDSYEEDYDAMNSDDQNTRLKEKGKAAYHKAKEKTKEKWEEIKQSDEYQNAKEKATELKQKAKDKAEDLLDKWLN